MGKLGHGIVRKGNLDEILHLKTCSIRIERLTDRMLHPGIGNKNPDRRHVGPHSNHPSGKQMKSLGDPVPTKKHDRKKCCFQKKGKNPFDGQRSTENIAHHPGVI